MKTERQRDRRERKDAAFLLTLPAYSGAFLLTIDNFSLFYLQFELFDLQF